MSILCFCSINLLSACRPSVPPTGQPGGKTIDSAGYRFRLLNAQDGAEAISRDSIYQFFEHINLLDMSIQMQRNFPSGTTREEAVKQYRTYLKGCVLDFSDTERQAAEKAMQKALEMIGALHLKGSLPVIQLIKTNTHPYGADAFFTRDNCIVMCEEAFKYLTESQLTDTFIHELSHIYSRYNPAQRKELYALIGFKPVEYRLILSPFLKEHMLLNPDAVDVGYQISVKNDQGETIPMIPVIFATDSAYSTTQPNFFGYLTFHLFQIIPMNDGEHVVNNQGVAPDKVKGYLEQLGGNTEYVIHPDETIADNFIYAVHANSDSTYLQRFKPQGQALIRQVIATLK